jgi:hypothetical protein
MDTVYRYAPRDFCLETTVGVGALVLVHYFDAIYILKISAPSNVVTVKTDQFRETQNLRKLKAVKRHTAKLDIGGALHCLPIVGVKTLS